MSDNPDELTAKAKMLIESKGKDRDTVNTAVEIYSQAVKLQYVSTYRTEKYGELSPECAPYYYNYGDALMRYLETEDLLESDPNKVEDDSGDYVAPKEKLSFNKTETSNKTSSVIDLDADFIEEPDEEPKTVPKQNTTEHSINKEEYVYLITYFLYIFHIISLYKLSNNSIGKKKNRLKKNKKLGKRLCM